MFGLYFLVVSNLYKQKKTGMFYKTNRETFKPDS